MLTGGGILDCVLALLLGLHAGRHWARGPGWAVLVGLVLGGVCYVLYFTVTSWIGTLWPQAVDGRVLGLHLILGGIAAPVSGALGALLAYRRSINQHLF